MVIAAGVDVVEFVGFVIAALRVRPLKQEAFDFVGRVERVAVLLVQSLRVGLENAANVGTVWRATLIDHIAEHQHLARPENIGWPPIERAPVDAEAKIALPLRGESANRRSVKSEIVPALDQELLVVIQHVQTAFQVAEQHGHGLDSLFLGQVFDALLLNLMDGNTIPALLLRIQIHLFQFVVRNRQEISQFSRHGSPY